MFSIAASWPPALVTLAVRTLLCVTALGNASHCCTSLDLRTKFVLSLSNTHLLFLSLCLSAADDEMPWTVGPQTIASGDQFIISEGGCPWLCCEVEGGTGFFCDPDLSSTAGTLPQDSTSSHTRHDRTQRPVNLAHPAEDVASLSASCSFLPASSDLPRVLSCPELAEIYASLTTLLQHHKLSAEESVFYAPDLSITGGELSQDSASTHTRYDRSQRPARLTDSAEDEASFSASSVLLPAPPDLPPGFDCPELAAIYGSLTELLQHHESSAPLMLRTAGTTDVDVQQSFVEAEGKEDQQEGEQEDLEGLGEDSGEQAECADEVTEKGAEVGKGRPWPCPRTPLWGEPRATKLLRGKATVCWMPEDQVEDFLQSLNPCEKVVFL